MNDKPDRRKVFIWRGPEDINRFADAIAEKLIAELFNIDGSLFWFEAGKTTPVNKDILRDRIAKHFVSIRLVNRDDGSLDHEVYSFSFPVVANTNKEPDQKILLNLIAALVERVAKGPSAPRQLSEQHRREIHMRMREGERLDAIAKYYSVDVDTIKQMAR